MQELEFNEGPDNVLYNQPATDVEVQIRADCKTVWVNIDGKCYLRAVGASHRLRVTIEDQRLPTPEEDQRRVITGQLYYGQGELGPLYSVLFNEVKHGKLVSRHYSAVITSHLTGEELASKHDFSRVWEAVEWCLGYAEY